MFICTIDGLVRIFIPVLLFLKLMCYGNECLWKSVRNLTFLIRLSKRLSYLSFGREVKGFIFLGLHLCFKDSLRSPSGSFRLILGFVCKEDSNLLFPYIWCYCCSFQQIGLMYWQHLVLKINLDRCCKLFLRIGSIQQKQYYLSHLMNVSMLVQE